MLNWGLIGAGGIARVFTNGMRFSKTGRIVAVASQTAGKAEQLAGDFGIPKTYPSYDALLADADVLAVYISTIHPTLRARSRLPRPGSTSWSRSPSP
jgi:predicted dehydrogenase